MKKLVKAFLVLILGTVICLPGVSSATVLNFDDITTFAVASIPANYGGFTWSGSSPGRWAVENNAYYRAASNNTYDFPSMNNAAYNANNPAGLFTVTNSIPFTFNGAYFGTGLKNDTIFAISAASLTITGYLNNNLIGSQTITFTSPYYPMSFISVDLGGIVNQLSFAADGFFLMDNFNYTAVPLPPSMLLLGSGLLGLAGWRRFRKS
jgi:hypothetical protein